MASQAILSRIFNPPRSRFDSSEMARPLQSGLGCPCMTYTSMKSRPAMTAIAAVIALSSTPLFAQNIEPVAEGPAPVVDTPPAPAADPIAPLPTTDTVTTTDPLAPEAAAKPAARKATPVKKTTAAHARPAPAPVASAAPATAHGKAGTGECENA